MSDIKKALDSAEAAIAFSVGDWSQDRHSAWVYGIICGWEDAMEEVAERFGWNEKAVERLGRHRAAVLELTSDGGEDD